MPKATSSKIIDSNAKGHGYGSEKPVTENRFKCEKKGCTSSFKRRMDLDRHLRVHEPAKQCPYANEGCKRMWRQKSNLQTHINTVHLKVKDIACPTPNCDFLTWDPATLTKHRIQRHGYKPTNKKLRLPPRKPRATKRSRSHSSATSASTSNSNASTSQSPPSFTRTISPVPFLHIYPIDEHQTLQPATRGYSSSPEPEFDESCIDPCLRRTNHQSRHMDCPSRDSPCLSQLPYPFERDSYAPAAYYRQRLSPPENFTYTQQPSNHPASLRLPTPPWRIQEESEDRDFSRFDAGRPWSS